MKVAEQEKIDFSLIETDEKIIFSLPSINNITFSKLEFLLQDERNKAEALEKIIEYRILSFNFLQHHIKEKFNLELIISDEIKINCSNFKEKYLINIFAKEQFIPIFEDDNNIVVASRFALNKNENIKIANLLKTSKNIELKLALNWDLQNLFQIFFRDSNKLKDICKILNNLKLQNTKKQDIIIVKDPIVEFANIVLEEACFLKADAISFVCDELFVKVRFKINSIFKEVVFFQKDVWSKIVNKIKVLAGVIINEVCRPQTSEAILSLLGFKYNVSFLFLNTIYGESINIKLSKIDFYIPSIEFFNFTKINIQKLSKITDSKKGVTIVNEVAKPLILSLLKDMNLENLDTINLIKNFQINLPFIKNTRSELDHNFLSQSSPDLLLINKEQYSPHLCSDKIICFTRESDVFSSIFNFNCNNISSAVIAKKMRKLCDSCKEELSLELHELSILRLAKTDVKKIFKSCGCEKCAYTGYDGSIFVCEILNLDVEMQELLYERESLSRQKFLETAKRKGFTTIFEDARLKILQGFTDIAELKRVIE